MTKEPFISGYLTINFWEFIMSIKKYYFTALVAAATLSGCASMPQNSVLNEARSDYQAAQSNPQVANLAPYELKQAGDALSKATDAASKQEDAATVSHLAYLAKQRTAIAQETTRQKMAEETVASAAKERGDIRLAARTAEVDKALQSAEAARQQAALSRMQSEISQEQARDAELRTRRLEAELEELNAKQTERGMVITLGDVLFDTNKAQLKAGGIRSLEKLAGFLKQYPGRNVRIEGYTDSTGSADYNLGLSDRRANAVRTSLLDMGINSDRISTRGYGQESPVAGNDTAMGRQLNRRVEIILSEEIGGSHHS
ncbi:MAG: OmpA family protein [Gammaproteobacteria bacterium]|nr:OmpA family protein [Gammaproteobacteria bacterium]